MGVCVRVPGVCLGQIVGVGVDLVDGEESGSCSSCRQTEADLSRLRSHDLPAPLGPLPPLTLEGLEALQRHPGGTGDKLQQPSSSLLLEGLHRPPEPADHPAVRGAVLQPGVGAPVCDVNLPQAAHYQLGGAARGLR